MAQKKYVEKGDIYFFYREKIDTEKPSKLTDIQRFYMVLVPDDDKARLFVVGKKKLPEIAKGRSKSTQREWMMAYKVGKPEEVGEELVPVQYETSTRGERREGEAVPVGEGRYAIFFRDDSTQLAYRLQQPKTAGKAQKAFNILEEASYVLSVRNPEVEVKGFPDESPNYPKKLKELFADKRWIDVSKSDLLNYEKSQLVLIGAHDSLEDLEITIAGTSHLFRNLGLPKEKFALNALEKGEFAAPKGEMQAKESEGDRTKGGRRGGQAAKNSASAAGIARALKGIDFPQKAKGLVEYAKDHGAQDEIVDVLEHLPKKSFETMADVQKALGEVR